MVFDLKLGQWAVGTFSSLTCSNSSRTCFLMYPLFFSSGRKCLEKLDFSYQKRCPLHVSSHFSTLNRKLQKNVQENAKKNVQEEAALFLQHPS